MDKQEGQGKNIFSGGYKSSTWGLPKSVVSFVVIAITSALVYRIITVQVALQFDFSSFLSLLLALFAVGLSALFYFKTTDTSNAFYDNTHKFTREVSQILGRIEAGFGERLRHLDEGYTGLRDKFEKFPFDVSKAREQEKEEQEEVAKKEAEIQKLLDILAERAQLAETEKRELFSRLDITQKELFEAKHELNHLQRRIRLAEKPNNLDPDFLSYLKEFFGKILNTHYLAMLNSSHTSKREYSILLEKMSPSALDYMKQQHLMDLDGTLTTEGMRLLRGIANDLESNQ